MRQSTGTVVSTDGTPIAFDRAGSGPPLVMIDPAGGYRDGWQACWSG